MKESMLFVYYRDLYYYLNEFENELFQQNEEKVIQNYNGIIETLMVISQHITSVEIDLDIEWYAKVINQLRGIPLKWNNMRDLEYCLENELRPYLDCQIEKTMRILSVNQIAMIGKSMNIDYLKRSIREEGHQELLSILLNQQLEEYHAEFSKFGLLISSYYKDGRQCYLQSTINPLKEAAMMAMKVANRRVDRYIICGCGIENWINILRGYRQGIEINIYCDNKELILLSLGCRNLERAESCNLHLYYDPNYEIFMKEASAYPEGVVIDRNVFVTCKNQKLVHKLKDMYFADMSYRNSEWEMKQSFEKNIQLCVADNSQVIRRMQNKTVYIIVGETSAKLQQLKEHVQDGVIVVEGTAFQAVLSAGIRPDYVIISDCKKSVWRQFENVKMEKIPVLMASTACSRVAEEYAGEKYILFQNGYEPAERYAKEQGLPTYPPSGSAAMLAMAVAVKSKAKRVGFLGLNHKSDTYSYGINSQIERLRKEGYKTEIINITDEKEY